MVEKYIHDVVRLHSILTRLNRIEILNLFVLEEASGRFVIEIEVQHCLSSRDRRLVREDDSDFERHAESLYA